MIYTKFWNPNKSAVAKTIHTPETLLTSIKRTGRATFQAVDRNVSPVFEKMVADWI